MGDIFIAKIIFSSFKMNAYLMFVYGVLIVHMSIETFQH